HYPLTHVPEDLGVASRVCGDLIQDPLHRRHERRPQTGATLLIPVGRLVELAAGLPTKEDRQAPRPNPARASAFTRSQGTTSPGLASCSASRRSSSCRCASLRCTHPGSAAMLSQISCIRARRSSTLRRSIPRSFIVTAIEYLPQITPSNMPPPRRQN